MWLCWPGCCRGSGSSSVEFVCERDDCYRGSSMVPLSRRSVEAVVARLPNCALTVDSCAPWSVPMISRATSSRPQDGALALRCLRRLSGRAGSQVDTRSLVSRERSGPGGLAVPGSAWWSQPCATYLRRTSRPVRTTPLCSGVCLLLMDTCKLVG